MSEPGNEPDGNAETETWSPPRPAWFRVVAVVILVIVGLSIVGTVIALILIR